MSTALLAVAWVVFLCLAVAGLLYVGHLSDRRAPEEANLVPTYSTRGAGIFDLLRVSAPFVRIAVYPHHVVVAALTTYVIPVRSIREVSLERTLFGRRVRLSHDSPSAPSPLLLWANPPDALAAAIRGVAPHASTAG